MTRAILCAALLTACVAVGCGGTGTQASSISAQVAAPDANATGASANSPGTAAAVSDYDEVQLANRSNVMPLMRIGVLGIGCSVVAEEPAARKAAYQCPLRAIFLAQKDSVLRYTCQPVDKAACAALLDRINAEVLRASGAAPKP